MSVCALGNQIQSDTKMDRFLIKKAKPNNDASVSTSTTSALSEAHNSEASSSEAKSSEAKSNEARIYSEARSCSEDGQRHKGRTYQASWKGKFPWIAYDSTKNKVFCYICTTARNMNVPLPSSTHDQESLKAFIQDGFSSWAKALERFRAHEKGNLHRTAVSIMATTNAGVNVAALLSAGKQRQMADARIALLAILSTLQFLSCQGVAIRGKTDQESNFMQML